MHRHPNPPAHHHLECDIEHNRYQVENPIADRADDPPLRVHSHHVSHPHRLPPLFRNRMLPREKKREGAETCGHHKPYRFRAQAHRVAGYQL